MTLLALVLAVLAAVPALSVSPTFTADVGGNFVIATPSNASLIVNGVDILATLQNLLSLQNTVAAMQQNLTALQSTVKAQQATISALTLNNTLLQGQVIALQVSQEASFLQYVYILSM